MCTSTSNHHSLIIASNSPFCLLEGVDIFSKIEVEVKINAVEVGILGWK